MQQNHFYSLHLAVFIICQIGAHLHEYFQSMTHIISWVMSEKVKLPQIFS